jgi:hypothetical protein
MFGAMELGIMSMLITWGGLAWLGPGLVVIYLIVRWRQERSGVSDPQLGWKVVMYFFLWNAIQLAVLGLALIVYSFLDDVDGARRTGLALILSGAIIGGAHAAGVLTSNHRAFPNVGRMFSGLHLVIFGIVGSVAIVVMTVNVLQVESNTEIGKIAGTGLVVYVVAWAVCALLHRRRYAL